MSILDVYACTNNMLGFVVIASIENDFGINAGQNKIYF